MKTKEASAEKLKKLQQKREKEIAKWEKEKAKATLPGYMAYFLLIICVVYIGDEVVTQLGGQMQSIIASELFAPIVGADFAVARMSALSSLAMIASAQQEPVNEQAFRDCVATILAEHQSASAESEEDILALREKMKQRKGFNK